MPAAHRRRRARRAGNPNPTMSRRATNASAALSSRMAPPGLFVTTPDRGKTRRQSPTWDRGRSPICVTPGTDVTRAKGQSSRPIRNGGRIRYFPEFKSFPLLPVMGSKGEDRRGMRGKEQRRAHRRQSPLIHSEMKECSYANPPPCHGERRQRKASR